MHDELKVTCVSTQDKKNLWSIHRAKKTENCAKYHLSKYVSAPTSETIILTIENLSEDRYDIVRQLATTSALEKA
jgi:acetylglutamate synthase